MVDETKIESFKFDDNYILGFDPYINNNLSKGQIAIFGTGGDLEKGNRSYQVFMNDEEGINLNDSKYMNDLKNWANESKKSIINEEDIISLGFKRAADTIWESGIYVSDFIFYNEEGNSFSRYKFFSSDNYIKDLLTNREGYASCIEEVLDFMQGKQIYSCTPIHSKGLYKQLKNVNKVKYEGAKFNRTMLEDAFNNIFLQGSRPRQVRIQTGQGGMDLINEAMKREFNI